jgi:hypothetical protein
MNYLPNIALAGRMGTGKTTIAWELAVRHGYAMESLAKPIKEILDLAYPIVGKTTAQRVATPTGTASRTGRELMQLLGTDAVRNNVDLDFWIRCLFKRLETTPKPWVIDDLRFPNEVEALAKAGFYTVRLVRPGIPLGGHASETQSDNLDVHFEVQTTASPREVVEWLMVTLASQESRRRATA